MTKLQYCVEQKFHLFILVTHGLPWSYNKNRAIAHVIEYYLTGHEKPNAGDPSTITKIGEQKGQSGQLLICLCW